MSPPIGPKGPADTTTGRVLPFRRPEGAAAPTTVAAPLAPSEPASAPAPASTQHAAATFDAVAGSALPLAPPLEGAALSQLVARLRATASPERAAPVGPVIVTTSEGRVLSGSVSIVTRAGLHELDGVVRVGGSLSVEGTIKNADLLALGDLKAVEGRLTFETLTSH
jgi:hypothetical protein